MIDLHSHLLPGLDDGAKDLEVSLAMAKIAVVDGITHIACTPHIVPGIYDNTPSGILQEISILRQVLSEADINLQLVMGADIHIAPDIATKLAGGDLPVLGESRYFLFEPTHHVLPPGIVSLCKGILGKGYIPVLTHPERLTWLEKHYDIICDLDKLGVVIQLTAMSVTGNFGRRARYWSDRMLDEGHVDIIAGDAHNTRSRPPILSKARDMIADRLGEDKARMMVLDSPARILKNLSLPRKFVKKPLHKKSIFRKIFTRLKSG